MYCKIILVGNLGREVEMRYVASGTAVASFSVATSEKWKDKDGQSQERTIWWRVTAWGKLAELCNNYLKKGSRVLVEGTPNVDPETGNPRIWTGQDGTPHTSLEITAKEIKFLSSKGGDGGQEQAGQASEASQDDIPF